MARFRSFLAVFISLGLVFTPAAAALPAKVIAQHAPAMDACPHHKTAATKNEPSHHNANHNGVMEKCDPAFCAMKCFQVVAVFPSAERQYLVHALPDASAPLAELVPVNWRPSTPPPRI